MPDRRPCRWGSRFKHKSYCNNLTFLPYNYFVPYLLLLSFSASTGIQCPAITERAMNPVLRPVLVSYQSLIGTRVSVSLT